MIEFEKYTLENGLTLIVHEDQSTPLVAVNVAYNVGSRDESEDRTGFAHLFEHLMFGGSKHIEDFDEAIQLAGGENNAFTNSDMTCFYNIVPSENLETVFWLESDRMMGLAINQKSLDIQKKVVIEEFKETCLNEPYGDMWHHMTEMAYKVHPYKWPTIGKDISHIENASLKEVKAFFSQFYQPNNAVISVAGNISYESVKAMVENWFGSIPAFESPRNPIKREPVQDDFRMKELVSEVPLKTVFMAFRCCGRNDKEYYATDLLSDILASGRSARFYQELYKGKALFSQIDCFMSESFDPGLFIVEGRPETGIELSDSIDAIWEELKRIIEFEVSQDELEKVKNKAISGLIYSEVNILNKAINLSYYELLGEADMIKVQEENYRKVTIQDIKDAAGKIFQKSNLNQLIYTPIKEV